MSDISDLGGKGLVADQYEKITPSSDIVETEGQIRSQTRACSFPSSLLLDDCELFSRTANRPHLIFKM